MNNSIKIFMTGGSGFIGYYFQHCTVIGGELAEDLFNRGLCLPSGTAMKEEDLNRVISVILSCKRQKAGSLDRRRHVRIYSTRANIL